jgi:uncharacterized RDD family membrane protein YckC
LKSLTINTAFNIELDFELAPLHKRILAFLFDVALQVAYVYLMFKLFNYSIDQIDEILGIGTFIVFIVPVFGYHLFIEIFNNGQSIGKKIFKLRVISLDGNPPSVSQYLLRWVLRSVDFTFFSFIPAILSVAITENGQRIGDLAAGTTVVTNKLPYSINDTIFKSIDKATYKVSYKQVMKLSDKDINTINNVLSQHSKSKNYEYINLVADKVKSVLNISTTLDDEAFLNLLIEDYNYLSRR